MKKLSLLAVCTLALYGCLLADNQDSATLILRKKAYDRFHEVSDTVTVRTWMNMDRMTKALKEVVEYDNQLLESYMSKDTIIGTNEQVSEDTLIKEPFNASTSSIVPAWFQMKYLFVAAGGIGLLVLVLIILLVKRNLGYRKLLRDYNEREETFDAKLNRLDILENEVIKIRNRENEIKAELEKGIVDYQDKMQTLRKRIEELAEENTRLENLNKALSEGKVIEGESSVEKNDEIKQEIIVELESILKRVKKSRK